MNNIAEKQTKIYAKTLRILFRIGKQIPELGKERNWLRSVKITWY